MDESGGFFKVYRKAQQSAFWTKKPYVNYRGVWVTMLMMTNWKDGFFDGHTIKVGQFATSIESLSKACGLSIKQVRNVVDTMKELGMITVENVANRFSLVTICNWGTYNGEESRRGQTKGKPRADRGQTEGKPRATIEEVKKGRREEREIDAASDADGKLTPENFSERAEAANGWRLTEQQLEAFCSYWTERDTKGRCRFESQRFFELPKRIAYWARRDRVAPAHAAAAKPERPVWKDCSLRCRHWDSEKRWCSKFVRTEPKSCEQCKEF
jgi:hypothetical protein